MTNDAELSVSFRALLVARGLTVADGRPLYAYRFTKREYEQNATLLRTHGRRVLGDRYGSALVVAHVAEWFRRERGGGHWDWIRPLESIGLHYGPGRNVSYADVEELVRAGLISWRRPLPQGGERLLAIVRESGFPVAAVREDPRISSWLKHAVLCAERGFQVDQAVVSEAWRVSDRIAQALFEPAIDLCRAIVSLRASVPPEARDQDPVAHLDAYQPSWRDDLPFDIEQEDVRLLVERMVRFRDVGGGALDVERWLVRAEGCQWVPRASLVLDGRLDVRRIPGVLREALDEGRRLRIFPRPPLSDELTAIAAVETYQGDEGPVHDLRAFVRAFDAKLPFETEARLFAQSGQNTVGEFVPPGGQALDDPVVALEVFEVDDLEEPKRMRVIGSSPCQTSKSTLALAVKPKLLPALQFSIGSKEIGTCQASGRRIVTFSGTAVLELDGTCWRWRTLADRDLDARPILVGDLVPNVRETVYRGVPRLWLENEGHVVAPRSASLHWRPRGRGSWRPWLDAEPRGAIDLAVLEDGELRHSVFAQVVPRDIEFEFDRNRRQLRISGLDAMTVGAFGAGPLPVRTEGGTHVVDLGQPSGTPMIIVRARWDSEVTLTLADPSYELRLIDENDELVGTRAVLALDGLGGSRILANHEISLYMELHALDAPRLAISRSVTGDVPLSALRDTIRQLLGRSSRLDASVVLSALGASEHIAEVRWYAEDVNPFVAAASDSPFAVLAAMQALDVRAVSLVDPAAGAHAVIAPASEDAMRCELEPLSPYGPWLVFGKRRSGEIVRPRILRATKTPVEPDTPLIRAIINDSTDMREREFDRLFADSTELPHEDVRRLIALSLLARREHLPASSIDALRALKRNPSTAVWLLAACDDIEERAALLDLQRDLPFLWCATTIASWLDAFGVRFEAIRADLANVGIELDVARLATNALLEISSIRPELVGHARAVYLSMVAKGAAAGKSVDGSIDVFQRSGRVANPRTEIDRLITRHQEGDAPPANLLSETTLAVHRSRWEPYAPEFMDLIAAPFAVAEHAAGECCLSPSELDHCRDAALYDPEYFETIVPARTNELLSVLAQDRGPTA